MVRRKKRVVMFLCRGASLLVARIFPALLDSIGLASGYVAVAVIWVFASFPTRAVMPETKGGIPEQAEANLRGAAKVRV